MKYIVSHKYRFVYSLIPKCATRSMLWYFIRDAAEDYGAAYTKRKFFTKGYFSFTFIRNPFDRVLSAYLNKTKNVFSTNVYERILKPHNLYPNMPFDEFVYKICAETDETADNHWKSQHTFISDNINFVGTLDHLQRDFQFVCEQIGIKYYDFPIRNHASVDGGGRAVDVLNRVDADKFYTDELYEIVNNRYEKDMELYQKVLSQNMEVFG